MKIEIQIPPGTPKYICGETTLVVRKLYDVDWNTFVELGVQHFDGENTQSLYISPTLLPSLIEALQKMEQLHDN